MGGVGGIAGGLVFRAQDKPGYEPGLYACIACCLLTIIIVGLITLRSWTLNKRADRGEVELEYNDVSFCASALLGCTDINKFPLQDGDQKGFRYTY